MKIFLKRQYSLPPAIRTCTCEYQEVGMLVFWKVCARTKWVISRGKYVCKSQSWTQKPER